jgi:hypothetical protein
MVGDPLAGALPYVVTPVHDARNFYHQPVTNDAILRNCDITYVVGTRAH